MPVTNKKTCKVAAWGEGSSEPEQFIFIGNRVVIFVHPRVRPKSGHEWRGVSLANFYTIRNRNEIRMRAFADGQQSLPNVSG
jgi:hypothetical protein